MSDITLSSMLTATVTVFLSLLFARAAWHKISEFTEFTGFVADYRLLPEVLVRPASFGLAGAEVLVVVLQLVPGGQVAGLSLAMALLSLYGLAMGVNILRGRTAIECGCGGPVQPLSWTNVIRNATLVAAGAAAVSTAPYALDAGGAIAALACGFTIWAGFILLEQILANSATARLTR